MTEPADHLSGGRPRPGVLMVSKPIAPPWNDSSKNLVKDLATAGARFAYHVMTPADTPLRAPQVVSEPIYRGRGTHTPGIAQNLRVLLRLIRRDDTRIAHFFFAPNPRTTAAARLALRLRGRVTVQTVCSRPASYARAAPLLFGDRVVVLSQHARQSLLETGAPPARLRFIPPGIHIPPVPGAAEKRATRERYGVPPDRPLIIFPGDYQFSHAAEVFARAILLCADQPATFVFACRIKQEASLGEEKRLRQLLADGGALERTRMLREVPDMLRLLGAADLCVMPADSLYAKMDLPLVLLEAMALGVPLVVADQPPLDEILQGETGVAAAPEPAALAAVLRQLLAAPPELRRLGENARREAIARYSIEEISRQHEDLYQELLEA